MAKKLPYPDNLIAKLNEMLYDKKRKQIKYITDVPTDVTLTIEYLISLLPPSHKTIIDLRYKQNMTLNIIGQHENVSRQCVDQKLQRALEYIINCHEFYMIYDGIKATIDGLKQSINEAEKENKSIVTSNSQDDHGVPIEHLGLTTHAENVLKKYDLHTMDDLRNLTTHYIHSMDQAGKTTITSILKALHKNNIFPLLSKKVKIDGKTIWAVEFETKDEAEKTGFKFAYQTDSVAIFIRTMPSGFIDNAIVKLI